MGPAESVMLYANAVRDIASVLSAGYLESGRRGDGRELGGALRKFL